MDKKRLTKRGFTLLEVMVVVLIAVIITAASVPVYKRNQERNRYLAATGLLMQLGEAARMALEDYPKISVSQCLQDIDIDDIEDLSSSALNNAPTSSNLIAWLIGKEFLSDIPPASDGVHPDEYKGYRFYVNVSNGSSSISTDNSCSGHPGVACMVGDNLIEEYRYAWIDKFGVIHNN